MTGPDEPGPWGGWFHPDRANPAGPPPAAPPPETPRRGLHRRRTRTLLLIGLVVVVALSAGGTVVAGRLTGASASGGCPSGGGHTTLRVTAAPDIAPAVRDAAHGLRKVRGGCATVTVTGQDPAATMKSLAGGGGTPPDAWVPGSTGWLAFAAASGAKRFGTGGPSLARSPVVIAGSDLLGSQPSTWSVLVDRAAAGTGPKFSMPNALSSTTGILSVLAIRTAMGHANPDPGIAQMRELTFRSRLASADADTDAMLSRLAGHHDRATATDVGVFPTTEQSVWAAEHAHPGSRFAVSYPSDGLVEADYPLALAGGADHARKALADDLTTRFRSAGFAGTLASHGLRPGQGVRAPKAPAPSAPGIPASYPAPSQLSATDDATAVATWEEYQNTPFQVLLLIDGSGSMNDPVKDATGQQTTKAGEVRQACVPAVGLFGTETSVQAWEFNTARSDAPYTEMLPAGPIDGPLNGGTRRSVLSQAMQTFSAPQQSGTPLYETVLRGEAALAPQQKAGTFTMIMVISDGKDEDSSWAMPLSSFQSRLRQQTGHPVPVYPVGYGKDADMTDLTAMAQATGGQAVNSVNPGDLASAIAKIFLTVHRPH